MKDITCAVACCATAAAATALFLVGGPGPARPALPTAVARGTDRPVPPTVDALLATAVEDAVRLHRAGDTGLFAAMAHALGGARQRPPAPREAG